MTAMVTTLEPLAGSSRSTPGERSVWDYVPAVTRTFLLRPEVYDAWKARGVALPKATDRRRTKLARIAAAAAARARNRTSRSRTSARPDSSAELLDRADLAVVLFAAKVATGADRITEGDVDQLRSLGLTEDQIFDIALAAAASCFFADGGSETMPGPSAGLGAPAERHVRAS